MFILEEEKKRDKVPEKPTKKPVAIGVGMGLALSIPGVGFLVFIILGIVQFTLHQDILTGSIWTVFGILFLCGMLIPLIIHLKAKTYNRIQYYILLEQYNQANVIYKKEIENLTKELALPIMTYVSRPLEEAVCELEKIEIELVQLNHRKNQEIFETKGIVKYTTYELKEIAALLKGNRAQNISEAINLYEKEERERKYRMEMAEIERQKTENKKRHYETLEEQAKKQTEIAQKNLNVISSINERLNK